MSAKKNVCVLMLVFALCIAMLTACSDASSSSESESYAPVSASEGTPESIVVEEPTQMNGAMGKSGKWTGSFAQQKGRTLLEYSNA